MKILQVCKYYYPYVGGIETVIKNSVDGLIKFDDVEIKILAVQNEKKSAQMDYVNSVEVTRVKNNGVVASMPISFQYHRALRKKLKEADIAHFHMPFPLAEFSSLFCSYKGKIVATWHSDVVKQARILKFYKPFMKKFLKRADKIIVASQNNIDSSPILKEFENKCVVIPFGIDVEALSNGDLINVLKGREGKVKILFVGRFVYYKGIDVLLRAFGKVVGADLFLVGQGPLLDEMKELANELKITDRTFFMSGLTDEELNSAFLECDFFVLPSVANSEAFGMVQLEAMAKKKPVINTRLGTGVPFVSLDGLTGLTVEPKNIEELSLAMQKLTNDESLRTKMGEAAYKRALENFTIEKMVNSNFEVYKDLLCK